MARTKVVIVYSIYTFVRRTVIVPHDDAEISVHTANIVKGERAIVVPLAHYQQYGPDVLLQMLTGQPKGNDRCMCVIGNKVDHLLCMDLIIDTHPQRALLVLDPTGKAIPGQTVVNGVPQ